MPHASSLEIGADNLCLFKDKNSLNLIKLKWKKLQLQIAPEQSLKPTPGAIGGGRQPYTGKGFFYFS